MEQLLKIENRNGIADTHGLGIYSFVASTLLGLNFPQLVFVLIIVVSFFTLDALLSTSDPLYFHIDCKCILDRSIYYTAYFYINCYFLENGIYCNVVP